MVGQQYGDDDGRRDSGYALYYMGINIGSLIAYLVTGYLQENWGWHYAFGAAAIGMAIGLIQYYFSNRSLSPDSVAPANPYQGAARQRAWMGVYGVLAIAAAVIVLAHMGTIVIEPVALAQQVAVVFTVIFFLYFCFVCFCCWTLPFLPLSPFFVYLLFISVFPFLLFVFPFFCFFFPIIHLTGNPILCFIFFCFLLLCL